MIIIFGCIIAMIGMAMIQDGLASIFYYHNKNGETWKKNHSWRLARATLGLVLIGIGMTQIAVSI